MTNKIQIIVGPAPRKQLKYRYESVGTATFNGGREIPALHLEEESVNAEDPRGWGIRHSIGPLLVLQEGTPTPSVGEVVTFRSDDRKWTETFEVSEVATA